MQQRSIRPVSDLDIDTIGELEARFALAVRQRELLEKYIKERLKPDKHFYKVPGSDKDSLTKEGAEVICLPHGYKPRYEQLSGPTEPPEGNAPFQITARCTLEKSDGAFGGQGIGSASSWQTKKDKTYQPRQRDPGLCHNATLKMAQKSAYIAATLNSTAASEFFTQDIEDGAEAQAKDSDDHFCQEHKTAWYKKGAMKSYGHKIEGTDQWCNEPVKAAAPAAKVASESQNNRFWKAANKAGVNGVHLKNWFIKNFAPAESWQQVKEEEREKAIGLMEEHEVVKK